MTISASYADLFRPHRPSICPGGLRSKGEKKIDETIHMVGRVKAGLFDETSRISGCDLVENPQIVKQKTPRAPHGLS